MEYYRDGPPKREASFAENQSMYDGSRGASMFNSQSVARTSRKKDPVNEAVLLSRATSQAMIAARSIVLSGGSQQTALSTAKAAAQSILAPHLSESDSVAATGKRFLERRKGKRQAEIVASMALLSVNNSVQQGGKQDSNPSMQWDATMLVQHPPPAQEIPMQRNMRTFEDCETLTNASNSLLAEIPVEVSHALDQKTGNKGGRRMQRETVSRLTAARDASRLTASRDASRLNASREVVGRDQSEIRIKDSRRQSKGKDTRLIESPRSKRRPSELPVSRPKDVVSRPIYTSNVPAQKDRILVPVSYSTDDGDDMTEGDGETTASSLVAYKGKSKNRGFLQQNVDPLLFSITSAFNCGFSPSETIAEAKKQNEEKRQFRGDNEEDGDTDEEDYDETRDDEEREVVMDAVMLGRQGDSVISAESAQIIRELNLSDSTIEQEEYYARKKEMRRKVVKNEKARRSAARTSVEEVVLRALSVRSGGKKVDRKQPFEEPTNDLITQSRYDRGDDVYTGVHAHHSQVEKPSLRVVTGAPAEQDYQVFQTSEKPEPVQSRKTLFQNFIRNRKKGRGATATGGPTVAETTE
jgi:hypothetical protein